MTARLELLGWLRAARGAVRWHLESGDDRLSVPEGFTVPPLDEAPRRAPRGPSGPAGPAAPGQPDRPGTVREPSVAGAARARPSQSPSTAPPPPVALPLAERAEALSALVRHVGDCSRCGLAEGRRAIVHAQGPVDARLAVIAEAPSGDDEVAGAPFHGPAGELLNRMLGAMGLGREGVYLCTVVLCRPPGDREPTHNEVAACGPYLKQRLNLVRPEAIVAFGEVPMRALVPAAGTLVKARGRWLDWEGIPVMPTWGPASLLADSEKKRPAWDDLKKVMARLGLNGPPPPKSP